MCSGNDLMIFDPHERYFKEFNCKNVIRFNNSRQDFFEMYKDQFEPYKHINFENGSKIDFKNEFNGSFFRFPIRNRETTQTSELCSTFRPIETIIYTDILESFFQDFNLILIFLRKIEKI